MPLDVGGPQDLPCASHSKCISHMRAISQDVCCCPSVCAQMSADSNADVHDASAKGFSLVANTLYDSGRPTYNDECVDYILNASILDEVKKTLKADAASSTPRTYTVSNTVQWVVDAV